MIIVKKDGQKVEFDSNRIYRAVNAAILHTKTKDMTKEEVEALSKEAERVARTIETIVSTEVELALKGNSVYSGEIQDQVEHLLMSLHQEGARQYIEFRKQREISLEGMTSVNKSISRVISKDKQVVNENANKDSDRFPTTRDLTAGSVAKALALKTMLPKHIANSHIKGDIHVHDLDYHPYSPMTNCSLINFRDMFLNGTKIGNASIESPKSIQTAVAQTAQIIANVSSNQYGGCSFDRMDETLAPYAELNYNKHLRSIIKFSAEMKGVKLSEEDLDRLVDEIKNEEEK